MCCIIYHTYVYTLESKRGYPTARHRHLLRAMDVITHLCMLSHICVYLGKQNRPVHIVTETLAASNMKRDNILQKRPIIDLIFVYIFASKRGHTTMSHAWTCVYLGEQRSRYLFCREIQALAAFTELLYHTYGYTLASNYITRMDIGLSVSICVCEPAFNELYHT